MRWPWVAREVYESAVREAETWRAEYRAMQSRYFDAVKPAVTPVAPAPEPAKKRPLSVVSQAIKQEANGDQRLAGYLRKRAEELRREGKSPPEIAVELAKWQSSEEAGMGVIAE